MSLNVSVKKFTNARVNATKKKFCNSKKPVVRKKPDLYAALPATN